MQTAKQKTAAIFCVNILHTICYDMFYKGIDEKE